MATFYGVMAIVLWGGLALLGASTTDIPAFQLLFLCFSISALLMFCKRLLKKEPLLAKPQLNMQQWLVGIIGLFGFHFCYFMALKKAPAIEVSLIAYLWPMFFALLIAKKGNVLQALLGGLIGFVGVCFVILGETGFTYNQNYLVGYLLSACCAFLWSGYSWFQSQSNNHVDDIGWLSIAVALLSLCVHVQLENSTWQFSSIQIVGIILLGAGPVGGAFYLWDIGIKNGNKKLLASLSFSTPLLSAIALSVAGLNPWSTNILIALSLILCGGVIANTKLPMLKRKSHVIYKATD